jgi:zinc transport system substrate-binding protein
MTADLAALEQELAAKLAPVRSVPFIVFHDAYHYFEARFGLNAVGSFTLSPGAAPGARRVAELHARIGEAGAACVFVEPQFEPAVVKAAVAGTGARVAVLDPLGAGLPPGANQYAQLLRALADNLATCLGGAP